MVAAYRTPTSMFRAEGSGNWGGDETYYTAEGDGISIGHNCSGAVLGESVEDIYRPSAAA